jgi:isoquinoline 1-oxidoreductase beta subunit
MAIAKYTGLKPEQVSSTSCTRRQLRPARELESDYVLEAVSIAVQLVQERASRRSGQARVDARGRHDGRLLPPDVRARSRRRSTPTASRGWHHRIVGQSILAGTAFESMMVKDGIDLTSVEARRRCPTTSRT